MVRTVANGSPRPSEAGRCGSVPSNCFATCWKADPGLPDIPVFKIGQKAGLLCERCWFLRLLSAPQGDLKCLLDQREHTQGWNLACGPQWSVGFLWWERAYSMAGSFPETPALTQSCSPQ